MTTEKKEVVSIENVVGDLSDALEPEDKEKLLKALQDGSLLKRLQQYAKEQQKVEE
jgi:hypothetical protein